VDVAANEQGRAQAADRPFHRRAADVGPALREVERRVGGRVVGEQDVRARDAGEALQQPAFSLRLGPLVGEAEAGRPGAAEAGDAQPGDLDDPAVGVDRLRVRRRVGQVVVAGDEDDRRPAQLRRAGQDPGDGGVVLRAMGDALRPVPGRVDADVARQQDEVGARLVEQLERALETGSVAVHVAHQDEPAHGSRRQPSSWLTRSSAAGPRAFATL
jgi:hypothetical protein